MVINPFGCNVPVTVGDGPVVWVGEAVNVLVAVGVIVEVTVGVIVGVTRVGVIVAVRVGVITCAGSISDVPMITDKGGSKLGCSGVWADDAILGNKNNPTKIKKARMKIDTLEAGLEYVSHVARISLIWFYASNMIQDTPE